MGLKFTIDNCTLCLIYDAALSRVIGTGFTFLKPEWVVTARHVVVEDGAPRRSLMVTREQSFHAQVLFSDPAVDLAVLELSDRGACKVPLFPSHERFAGGQGLICCGYAPSRSSPADGRYELFVNSVPEYEREVRSRSDLEEELVIFKAPFAEGGHSGGPVFGEGGGVVGAIIELFQREGVEFARATSILPLLRHLTFGVTQRSRGDA